MLESIKRFFKVYPLPIFIILLSFTIYYFIFETMRNQEEKKVLALTEEESRKADALVNNDANLEASLKEVVKGQESQKGVANTQAQNPNNTQKIETKQGIAQKETLKNEKNEIPLQQKLEEKLEKESIEEEYTIIASNVRVLNVREMPWAESRLLAKLEFGKEAVLLDEREGWLLLGELNSKEPIGWVAKRFIRTKEKPKITQKENVKQETQKQEVTEEKRLVTSSVASLNIRQDASQNAEVVGKLTPQNRVFIAQKDSKGWVLIVDEKSGKTLGWVLESYTKEVVKQDEENTKNVTKSNTKIFISKVPFLNIRSNASTMGEVLGKLTPKDRVNVLAISKGWAKIKALDTQKSGWVLERSLKEI